MRSKVVILVGSPAVGKSSIVRAYLQGRTSPDLRRHNGIPFHMKGTTMVLGDYHDESEAYPGTDRMSFSIQPKVQEFMLKAPAALGYLWEGDRLANGKMFDWLQQNNFDTHLVFITCDGEQMSERRGKRDQDPTFQKGRDTKVDNLYRAYRHWPQCRRMLNNTPAHQAKIVGAIAEILK